MKYRNCLIILFAAIFAASCSYTNHFLDEEEFPESSNYHILKDLDVSAYDSWTYINLQTGQTMRLPDTEEWIYHDGTKRAARESVNPPFEWHLAIHRYEFRTNGAKVMGSGITNFENYNPDAAPEGDYITDEVADYETESTKPEPLLLVMDLTYMFDDNIGYAAYPRINRALCSGILRKQTGTMPPTTYEPTQEIFTLTFPDGKQYALQIVKTSGGPSGGESGRLTIKYMTLND